MRVYGCMTIQVYKCMSVYHLPPCTLPTLGETVDNDSAAYTVKGKVASANVYKSFPISRYITPTVCTPISRWRGTVHVIEPSALSLAGISITSKRQ